MQETFSLVVTFFFKSCLTSLSLFFVYIVEICLFNSRLPGTIKYLFFKTYCTLTLLFCDPAKAQSVKTKKNLHEDQPYPKENAFTFANLNI